MASQKEIDAVWEKGKKIPKKDPNLYRKDNEGYVIFKTSYGKQSEMGWEIDHRNPISKGGTDSMRNKQPLHWRANRKKGDKY